MSFDQKVYDQLEKAILKHCTHLSDEARVKQLDGFVDEIILMYENCREAAHVSEDLTRFEELERHLQTSARLLRELSPASKRKLNFRIQKLDHEIRDAFNSRIDRTEEGDRIYRRYASLRTLLDAVVKMRGLVVAEDRKEGPVMAEVSAKPASIKRNYEAAAVAAVCTKIWAEQGDEDEYKPPKLINADRINHPMGDFIQDVFDILRIGAQASSALNALYRMGGPEALILSVELG